MKDGNGMAVSADRGFCALTRVKGNYADGKDSAELKIDGGVWKLIVKNSGPTTWASAQCMIIR